MPNDVELRFSDGLIVHFFGQSIGAVRFRESVREARKIGKSAFRPHDTMFSNSC